MLRNYINAWKTHPSLPVLQLTNKVTKRFNLSHPRFLSRRLSNIENQLYDFDVDMTRSFWTEKNFQSFTGTYSYRDSDKVYLAKIVTLARNIELKTDLPDEISRALDLAKRSRFNPHRFPDLWFGLQCVDIDIENTVPIFKKNLNSIHSIFEGFDGTPLAEDNTLEEFFNAENDGTDLSDFTNSLLEISLSYEVVASHDYAVTSYWQDNMRNLMLFCDRIEALCNNKIKLYQIRSHLICTAKGKIKCTRTVHFRILPPSIMEKLIRLASNNSDLPFHHDVKPVPSDIYFKNKFNFSFHIMTPIKRLPWLDAGMHFYAPAWMLFLHDYYHVADFLLNSSQEKYFGQYLLERLQDLKSFNDPVFHKAVLHILSDYESVHYQENISDILLSLLEKIERSVLFLNEAQENNLNAFREKYHQYDGIHKSMRFFFSHPFNHSKRKFGLSPLLRYLDFLEQFKESLINHPPNSIQINQSEYSKIIQILDKKINMLKSTLTRDFTDFDNWSNSIRYYVKYS